MRCELMDGLFSVPSKDHAVAQSLQNLARHLAHSFMVFGNQDGFGPSSDRSIIHMA